MKKNVKYPQLTLAVARLVWVMLTMRPRQEARMSPMPARLSVTNTEARNPGGSRCRGSALWGLQSGITGIFTQKYT